MPEESGNAPAPPYPDAWDRVAEIRVFRTNPNEWERLIAWRGDMRRKGWKLLRVNTRAEELTAVFGRTRPEMQPKEA